MRNSSFRRRLWPLDAHETSSELKNAKYVLVRDCYIIYELSFRIERPESARGGASQPRVLGCRVEIDVVRMVGLQQICRCGSSPNSQPDYRQVSGV